MILKDQGSRKLNDSVDGHPHHEAERVLRPQLRASARRTRAGASWPGATRSASATSCGATTSRTPRARGRTRGSSCAKRSGTSRSTRPRRILGLNAAEFYGFDVDALRPIAERDRADARGARPDRRRGVRQVGRPARGRPPLAHRQGSGAGRAVTCGMNSAIRCSTGRSPSSRVAGAESDAGSHSHWPAPVPGSRSSSSIPTPAAHGRRRRCGWRHGVRARGERARTRRLRDDRRRRGRPLRRCRHPGEQRAAGPDGAARGVY